MQTEMREHIESAAERFTARGMSPADARRAAEREFGNVGVIQEQARDIRGGRWVHDLAGDVRFACRYFARHKATTAIIVAVLALGTGANAMIFSMVQAQFFRPAPAVPKIDAHVMVWSQERSTRAAQWQDRGFTYSELTALTEHREVFSSTAAWTEDQIVLRGDSSAALSVGAQFVTPNYFRVLGVPLSFGRDLAASAGNDVPDMTAIIAFETAEKLYGSAVAAVGQRVLANELPVRIVGVAPPRFQGALRNMHQPALWIPLSARSTIARVSPRWMTDQSSLSIFGRLAIGVSSDRATALARQVVASALPDSATRVGMARSADVLGMNAPPPGQGGSEMALALTFILGVGILILLVACTNVSSLMVAAAVGRRHEIAVRTSLGASRARLVRQLVTESTLLALAGSAIGLTLAWWVLTYQERTEIDGVVLSPDGTTFVFVLIAAVVTGMLFGLSPALHVTRDAVGGALRDSGAGISNRSRLQRGLVVAQIALSQPLLLLLGVMLALVIADYKPLSPDMSRRVIAVDFRPVTTGAASQRPEAVDSLATRIAERPEVTSAVPDATGFGLRGIVASDRAVPRTAADTSPTVVTLEGAVPGWFTMVEIPIIFGRDVSYADTMQTSAKHPVVIGSDLARALWGEANPVGRTLASPSLPGFKQDSMAMVVVGVYDASHQMPGATWGGGSSNGDEPVRVYTARGKQWRHDRILVRTRGPAAPFVPELRKFVRGRAPSLPVTSMVTLAQADEQMYRDTLREAAMAGAAGALALLVASLGLYGIVSLAVRQRTREIGIRIAVGAEPMQVARMFLTSGVRVCAFGLAIGLPLSVLALKIALSQHVVIAPQTNPYMIGAGVALVLFAVASAATWVPARRAAFVEPSTTLRVE
jgi:predicted permease